MKSTGTRSPGFVLSVKLAIRLAAGHDALDIGSEVRILDRQPGVSLVVRLMAGHDALDIKIVVRIHDHQL